MRAVLPIVSAVALAAVVGCEGVGLVEGPPLGTGSVVCPRYDDPAAAPTTKVVAGSDDRAPWAKSPPWLRERIRRSVATLVDESRLLSEGCAGGGRLAFEPLALCRGERFEGFPTLGRCSAVLIDGDKVLTAGHCLDATHPCDRTLVVFDDRMASDTEGAPIGPRSIFRCQKVLAFHDDGAHVGAGHEDYAVLSLDRAVAEPFHPAPVPCLPDPRSAVVGRLDLPAAGADLVVAGHPLGLPLVASSGVARTGGWIGRFESAGLLTYDVDTSGGDSGGPVFDRAGVLVGVHLGQSNKDDRHPSDLVNDGEAGCARWDGSPSDAVVGLGMPVARALHAACRAGLDAWFCGAGAKPVPVGVATEDVAPACAISTPRICPGACQRKGEPRVCLGDAAKSPCEGGGSRTCTCTAEGLTECGACG